MFRLRLAISATFLSIGANQALACAVCGCSLSSDAATGYSTEPGWSIGVQYDYINQNQLRHGTSSISRSQAALVPDQEVEDFTKNQYFTLGIGYTPDPSWNFRLLLPYVNRNHQTYGQDPTLPLTPDQISGAQVNSLGDLRFLTNYQGFLPTHNLGVQLGIKLPTGNYGGPNVDGTGTVGRNPAAFSSGQISQNPSPGNLLDTNLQAGTGSTDLILGAYYYQPVSQDFDLFLNGQYQFAIKQALNQPGADYRPGDLATVSFGVSYVADPGIVPQVQINLTHRNHDTGALADTNDSAGTVVYFSPGAAVTVARNMQMYGFVQVPLYSNLQGYQLLPRWNASIGASFKF